jgi:hypothetical protein
VYLVQDKTEKQDFASKCIDKAYLMEDGGFVDNSLFNNFFFKK